jgi:glycosyltransferase involved in cell wall biosynthesis
VEGELKARGFTVDVLAHRLLPESLRMETGYRPVFSKGTYDFPYGANALHSMVKLWLQARVYAEELRVGLTLAPPPRIVFCHTLSDFELVGWSRFLSRRPLPCPLVLMLRETPGYASVGLYRRWLHPYTGLRARSLRSINRHAQAGFVLATDTDALSADYASIFNGKIRTFPIPLGKGLSADGGYKTDGAITLGYLGDCRAAKGFPRLAPMITEVLGSDSQHRLRFLIQLYRGTFHSGQNPPGWEEIERLAERFPGRVETVKGVLDDAGYQKLISSLNAFLIPNDHPAFRAGSSNVFCESVAAGKPVVVAEGTWMATQLARYGGGRVFSLVDPVDFGHAVLKLAQDWETVLSLAQSFAGEWRAQHNGARLVDALLQTDSRHAGS